MHAWYSTHCTHCVKQLNTTKLPKSFKKSFCEPFAGVIAVLELEPVQPDPAHLTVKK